MCNRRGRRRGQTLIEHGLMLAMIAIIAIVILTTVGRKGRDVFVTVNNRMVTVDSGAAGGGGGGGMPGPPPLPKKGG